MDKNRPNILFLMTDEQHADCLGFMGHPMVKTPNLDRLAERGAWFNQMFACSAICAPSRTSFMTGMYLRGHGLIGNRGPAYHPYPSLAGELRRAGYTTALTGKCHLAKHIEAHFDHIRGLDIYQGELRDQGFTYPEHNHLTNKEFQSSCSKIPEHLQNEVWTADAAIDFLGQCEQSEQPFFLWCSFQRPHCPHTPPDTFDSLYDPEEVPVDWQDYHAFEASLLQNRPMIEDFWKLGSVRHNVNIFRKAVCRYFSLITLIDREIGRILEALERTGQIDNTLIVFTSDHGDFAGHYGQLGKNLPGYDDLLRIPFIYVDPKRPADGGRCIERLFQNVDLFPSLMERIGLATPANVQGQSFLYALDGAPGPDRDYIFAETPMEKTIRCKNWKLTFFVRHPEKGQLFKMGPVPDETNNLWDDPAYRTVRERMLLRLMEWMVACEQPPSICFLQENYISTRWYDHLKSHPTDPTCSDFRDLLHPEEQ